MMNEKTENRQGPHLEQVALHALQHAHDEGLGADDCYYVAVGAVARELRGDADRLSPEVLEEAKTVVQRFQPAPARQGRPPAEDAGQVRERVQLMLEPRYTALLDELAREKGLTRSALLRKIVLEALVA